MTTPLRPHGGPDRPISPTADEVDNAPAESSASVRGWGLQVSRQQREHAREADMHAQELAYLQAELEAARRVRRQSVCQTPGGFSARKSTEGCISHVPCLRAREQAKAHWKVWLSSTCLQLLTSFFVHDLFACWRFHVRRAP